MDNKVRIAGVCGSLRRRQGKTNSAIILERALDSISDIADIVPFQSDFDGVILSTPVYFGSCSSGIQDFIRECDLTDKAVGCLSVGAKRNGGQETAILHALWLALQKGAVVTGNGPPTSQYGGTAWGGNMGAVVSDNFGIETSIGTARQVVELARILKREPIKRSKVIISIPPIGLNIKPCLACPVCPNGDLTADYTCIIDDGMKKVRESIKNADAICADSADPVMMERTRFIRRNHFEWSGKFGIAKGLDYFRIRMMAFFLRQNMFYIDDHDQLHKHAGKSGRIHAPYVPVGYEDAKDGESCYRD